MSTPELDLSAEIEVTNKTFLLNGSSEEELQSSMSAESYYGDNKLAIDVLHSKYLAPGEEGPFHIWDRVAAALASVEEDSDHWHTEFFQLLKDFKFVPGGRVMHGAGRDDAQRKPTLSNCYVIPIEEDSLEGIYRCLSESAVVYRTGGGVGTDLSILRPKGSPVNATVDASPGVTAFMNLLSESTNAVSQAGRRGALMLTLRVDHPDIEDFIVVKNDDSRTKVQYANISVLITHEFMEAVLSDSDFELKWGGKVHRTVKAKELWDKIITNAHSSAEPGIIFWDTMREYHNVEYANPLESTNPCGEQPLASYTACNLGNLNLVKFVDAEGKMDHGALAEATQTAVRFLDNVIDYNKDNHAFHRISESVSADRRVGLGITGMADALLLMKVKYDSEKALSVMNDVMVTLRNNAYNASIKLAVEKGSFPLFDREGIKQSKFIQSLPGGYAERIEQHGLRNSTLITMPPVGTGSIVAETSSGIEPIFCTSYKRRVKQEDGETFKDYKVYHPMIEKVFGDDEDLPDYVVTAHEIDPYFRVKMQGVIQRYTDSSISSTINLAEDTTVETVADIYITAYKQGLKGVTVYREGSREGILQTESQEEQTESAEPSEFRPTRKRPTITKGVTERVKTGEGNLYITINEDDQGICEVFSTIGKAGGNAAAQSEAVSRLISLSLRAGVDPQEIVGELKGISGSNPVWQEGELILSTPDAIGKALERYLHRREGSTVQLEEQYVGSLKGEDCPECGLKVVLEGGCTTCKHCGWSKC